MAMTKAVRSRRDRWADWLVIGVVAVALSLGWGIKAWTEGGTERFTSPETGLTLHYPTGWLMSRTDGYLLKVRDPHSGLFKTTYAVMADRLDPARPMSLVDAVNATSVSRARKLAAFRLLDIETVGEEGKPPDAVWSRYVYVDEKPDPFRESLPVVVLGLDYTAVEGEHLYTYTLLAGEADFEEAEKGFRAFIKDAGFGG
ncbi:MAG: hypothetical protein JSV36_15170 [Anaerolineae bacterium]|nr:MAG: hypothetical protein JSV36_15170 [Anaerolineae bacterium]